MVVRFLVLCTFLLWVAPVHAAVITTVEWESKPGAPWSYTNGTPNIDCTMPASPAGGCALRFTYPAGTYSTSFSAGRAEYDAPSGNMGTTLFLGAWMRYSNPFAWNPVGTKMNFFVWLLPTPDACGNSGANLALGYGFGGVIGGTPQICWADGTQSFVMTQNQGHDFNFADHLGEWHWVEQQVTMNTPGLRDGIVNWWIDGILVLSYNNVPMRESGNNNGFNFIQHTAEWGGGGGTITQTGYWWVDHTVISTTRIGMPSSTTPPPTATPAPDTSAPTVPTSLTASVVSSSAVNLAWSASSDNVGVTGYNIFRNGTQITTTASPSYADTGLSASTAYTYTVAAYDAAGNTSTQSSSVVATTQASAPVSQLWPNEPAGSSLVTDWGFNSLIGGGWSNNGGSATIVSDATAPISPSNVAKFPYPVGFPGGVGPDNIYYILPSSNSWYVGYMWKPSNPWEGHPTSVNKISFLFGNGLNGHLIQTMWGTGTGPFQLMMGLEFPNQSNAHLGNGFGDNPGTWQLFGNMNSCNVTLGNWHRVEEFYKASTNDTSRDGIVKWWLDGTLCGNYLNVNTPSQPFVEFHFDPTWGGVGSTKSESDSYSFDHVHLSIPSLGITSTPTPTSAPTPIPTSISTPTPTPTPPPSSVGTVTDLTVAQLGSIGATLSFTDVTDGTGAPATYDIRYSSTGSLWGSAPSVAQGTCTSPMHGTQAGLTKTCTVLGLTPATDYQFELVPFRGTMNVDAVFGPLSNIAGGKTLALATPTPAPTITPTPTQSSGGGGSSTPLPTAVPATVFSGGGSGGSIIQTIPTSPPSSSTGTPLVLTRPLYRGTSGTDVMQVQDFLISHSYLAPANDTGLFGPLTMQAIEKFQCAEAIVCSGTESTTGYGVIGPATRARLQSLASASAPASTALPTPSPAPALTLTRSLYRGMQGDDVKTLQAFLIGKGYLAPSNITGFFGVLTRQAVQKFQCAQQIICSGTESSTGYGVAGVKTRGRLEAVSAH